MVVKLSLVIIVRQLVCEIRRVGKDRRYGLAIPWFVKLGIGFGGALIIMV